MKPTMAAALLAATLLPGATPLASSAQAPVMSLVHTPVVVNGTAAASGSTNWSGYVVQSSSHFSAMSGSWTQPTANCNTSGSSYSSFWIGIDGYSSNTVEQLGTDSDCASLGHPSYYAWYEMYPAPSAELSSTRYPVRPGDVISTKITRTANSYTLSMTSNRGWTFSTTQTLSASNSSAEWITEAPEVCTSKCSLASLTNYGTVKFTAATATPVSGPATTLGAFEASSKATVNDITMLTSQGATRAVASSVGATGTTFSDTWKHS